MSVDKNEAYFDMKYKIMVVGETKVGKTSLIKRYTKNEFSWIIFINCRNGFPR